MDWTELDSFCSVKHVSALLQKSEKSRRKMGGRRRPEIAEQMIQTGADLELTDVMDCMDGLSVGVRERIAGIQCINICQEEEPVCPYCCCNLQKEVLFAAEADKLISFAAGCALMCQANHYFLTHLCR